MGDSKSDVAARELDKYHTELGLVGMTTSSAHSMPQPSRCVFLLRLGTVLKTHSLLRRVANALVWVKCHLDVLNWAREQAL